MGVKTLIIYAGAILATTGCIQFSPSTLFATNPNNGNPPGSGINLPGTSTPDSGPACTPPISAVDVSHPKAVVGSGTAASCTQSALAQALPGGGIITFNCGGPATISVTSQLEVPLDRNTTLDGSGVITLDGMNQTRIFHADNHNFRTNRNVFTLQNIAVQNAAVLNGTPIPDPSLPLACSRGSEIDGSGAGIFVADLSLHVINVTFKNNRAAPLGPDVGGGAIYVAGALDVTVVNCKFLSNGGANAGAIGSLNSELSVYNSSFVQNAALGHDANSSDPSSGCPLRPGGYEVGSGGNGGAIAIDGGTDGTHTFCGDTFDGNKTGDRALGGAIFRTPDLDMQTTVLDRCYFTGNVATNQGGGAVYFHNSDLRITASTFENNAAVIGGAIDADGTNLSVDRSTFYNNHTSAQWGTISLFGNSAMIRDSTFVANRAATFAPIINDSNSGANATFKNCLFVNNTDGQNSSCAGTQAGSNNLQWPAALGPSTSSGCALAAASADPLLGAYGFHGGPTQNFLPGPGSPAIGAGAGCLATDQRGVLRPTNGICTIGSIEVD